MSAEIGVIWKNKMAPWPPLEIPFSESYSKMLLPIDLKLIRVVGHFLSYVDYKVGAVWKNKIVAILNFHFLTLLEETSADQFEA